MESCSYTFSVDCRQHRKEQIFLGKGHVKLGIMPCVSPGKTLQKGNHKNDSWFMHGK
jgi:hypothetical protein